MLAVQSLLLFDPTLVGRPRRGAASGFLAGERSGFPGFPEKVRALFSIDMDWFGVVVSPWFVFEVVREVLLELDPLIAQDILRVIALRDFPRLPSPGFFCVTSGV